MATACGRTLGRAVEANDDKPVYCWDPKSNRGNLQRFFLQHGIPSVLSAQRRGIAGGACADTRPTTVTRTSLIRATPCLPMSHIVDAFLCRKKSDCPVHPPTGSNPKGCRHTPDLPPGVKACDYGFDEENP